jgi:hypothetical protein
METIAVLATALKVRMLSLVRNSAWFALRRYGGDRPDRQYFDVPMARLALLKAEAIVLLSGKQPADAAPPGLPPAIEDLRSEAVAAVTLDGGVGPRDEAAARADLGILVDLTVPPPTERCLTVADILAFLEVDAQAGRAVLFRSMIT